MELLNKLQNKGEYFWNSGPGKKEMKQMARPGIPDSLRGSIWPTLIDAKK